ncbi:unnamed protein product [Durusdinium trenchii]|uniref:Uncharacterized protein n=1 Tax=Durusdinium trenchii TaxID=1381693 RepID=A0ABP0KFA0_9DINO
MSGSEVGVLGAEPSRCDSQSQRIQEIASEVLRLRLVQSQYKQLEGQLKAAVDQLQQASDKVDQFSQYLEQGLRPGGSIGTLGGSFSGVEADSLLGLMECLCVVCSAPVVSRKQEDLLAATKWLLQDPGTLVRRLAELPCAPGAQSRRLAPYLLTCASSWRGHLNEAGQCYEALKSWLSCYYQFSLVSGQMEANAIQLQHQVARMSSGVKVTSAQGISVARRASRDVREASAKSPLGRLSDRNRAVGQQPSSTQVWSKPLTASAEKRQVAHSQSESSPRVTRLSSQLAMSTVLGNARMSRSGSACAPPGPPVVSPRRQPYSARASYTEPPKTVLSTRRHIVPARARRPSESSSGVAPQSSRLTPSAMKSEKVEEAKNGSTPLSPRNGQATSAFCRSRSLQSITEPEAGATPTRVARPAEVSTRRSQVTPIGGRLSASASQPTRPIVTSVRPRQGGSITTPPATPGVRFHARTTKSTLPCKDASGRDAIVRDLTPSAWALATSRSSPSLETRVVLGRQIRETAMATPRPLFSARAMR